MRIFKKIPFTKAGYEKLQEELANLEKQRPEAVDTLSRARAMGDLSENGLYKAARARLSSIDHRIERLRDLLKQAVVTKPAGHDTVQIGSVVEISNSGRRQKVTIVGGYESNPSEHKISHVSPLGKALVKQKKGARVTVSAPAGEVEYVIESIK